MSALNWWRGYKRLFFVLTLGWMFFCTVLIPLYGQWHLQNLADSERAKEYATCGQLTGGVQSCFALADRNWSARADDRALEKFWAWDVAFWKFELAAIILPPMVVYGLAVLMRWIWGGFVSPRGAEER